MILYQKNKAFTLIEVLIAWFILCLVLLSLLIYEMDCLKINLRNYWRIQAILQVNAMMEQLRANQDTQFRNREITHWNQINHELLPHSLGNVSCHEQECSVKLQWGQFQESLLLMEML